MAPDLFLVRFAKADGTDLAAAEGENETVKFGLDLAERDIPRYAIVEAVILMDERRRHIHFLCLGQRNAVPGNVARVFIGIKRHAQGFCTPNNKSSQEFSEIQSQVQECATDEYERAIAR
jgi:hypothetical protein